MNLLIFTIEWKIVGEVLSHPVILGALAATISSLIINHLSKRSSDKSEILKKRIVFYEKLFELVSKTYICLSSNHDRPVLEKDCWTRDTIVGLKRGFTFPKIFFDLRTFLDFKIELANLCSHSKLYADRDLYNKIKFLDSYLGVVYKKYSLLEPHDFRKIGYLLALEIEELVTEIQTEIQTLFKRVRVNISFANDNKAVLYEDRKRRSTLLNDIAFKGVGPNKCKGCGLIKSCTISHLLLRISSGS